MKKFLSGLILSGLVAVGLGAAVPSAEASAFSVNMAANTAKPAEAASDKSLFQVIDHRDRDWRRHHRHEKYWRHHHRKHWRHHRRPRSGFYFEFGTGVYRPHVYVRPRYVVPRYVTPRATLSSAHVRWCYDRYRSYRAWDNTFQPYHGPRRACISPYWR